MSYILEVQKFYSELNPEWNGKSIHVGYMDKFFSTKKKAAEYYDEHNPHMRGLNAHGEWRSDWDPETHLMYVVREHYYEHRNIPPFHSPVKTLP